MFFDDNYGVRWIPYRHQIHSSRLRNQLTPKQCQSACASQVLLDNHGINYSITNFYDELDRSATSKKFTLLTVAMHLNKILGYSHYRVLHCADPKAFISERNRQGKSWIVSVRPDEIREYGHNLVVCGLTRSGMMKVVDPWGEKPGNGAGTLGFLSQEVFLELWENSNFIALYSIN